MVRTQRSMRRHEPSSGSDAGSARMAAIRRGNHWVLNGTKTFCTDGHHTDILVVIAVTDRAAHTHELSAFIVEKDTKGCRLIAEYPRLEQFAESAHSRLVKV